MNACKNLQSVNEVVILLDDLHPVIHRELRHLWEVEAERLRGDLVQAAHGLDVAFREGLFALSAKFDERLQ